MTGESEYKLAEKISTRWQIGYNDARRLIRTETTYVSNQAELESYKEIGIEEYKYEAVLDSATSEICRELHGKKFKISEAKPRKNYPPMHPWCRSTTMAVIPEIPEITEEQDNAIEGWLNDEEDLDYEEWCEKHHINPKTGKKVYQGNSKSAKAAQATQEQPKAATTPKAETVSEQPKTVAQKPETAKKTPKSGTQKPNTAKKSPKSGTASDYSYGHTAEFETTIPTIETIDTPTVKTTEKIYTDEVTKKIDFSGKSGIIKKEKNDNTYKKFNTGEEVNEYFGGSGGILERQKSVEKQWLKFLTSEEKSAISEYCADGYFDINTYLREMPGAEYINAEDMKSFANDLDSAINKFELKDNIVVYRGIENNALKRIDLNNAVGSIYEDDGYMSTSPIQIDLIARKDAILEIRVPAGKGRGAYVNSLSGFKDEEYEFLLKRGTRCKINAVDTSGEKPIIKMEVIK